MHMLQSEILKNYLKFRIQGKSGSHVLIVKWFECKFSGCNDRQSYTSSLKHPSPYLNYCAAIEMMQLCHGYCCIQMS